MGNGEETGQGAVIARENVDHAPYVAAAYGGSVLVLIVLAWVSLRAARSVKAELAARETA